MQKDKLNSFFSTLNFVLLIIGYQLATSLFLPATSDFEGVSRAVTVPYRIFALLISLLVIVLNLKSFPKRPPLVLIALLIYWLLFIVRIFYDLYVENVFIKDTFQLWMYIMGICLPAVFSVLKSYEKINFERALKWALALSGLTLIMTLFTNQIMYFEVEGTTSRSDANVALNTISFGHVGTTAAILGLYVILKYKPSLLLKILLISITIFATITVLKAGSRGPLLALILVLLFWFISSRKQAFASILFLGVTLLSLVIFIKPLLELIGQISPIMENRLRASIYEQDTSDREPHYNFAWEAFQDNPFIGQQFAIFRSGGGYIYPHNIVLEAMMALGIIGAILMLYILLKSIKKAYFLAKVDSKILWVALLLLQQIIFNMTSGTFYENYLLSALLVLVFVCRVETFKTKLYD